MCLRHTWTNIWLSNRQCSRFLRAHESFVENGTYIQLLADFTWTFSRPLAACPRWPSSCPWVLPDRWGWSRRGIHHRGHRGDSWCPQTGSSELNEEWFLEKQFLFYFKAVFFNRFKQIFLGYSKPSIRSPYHTFSMNNRKITISHDRPFYTFLPYVTSLLIMG